MERSAFELGEVFEEYRDERSDILSGLDRSALSKMNHVVNIGTRTRYYYTHHFLTIVGIGKANTNRLVDEEDIRMVIPGILERLCGVRAGDPARPFRRGSLVQWHGPKASERLTKLHEKAKSRRAARSTIRPEENIVRIRIASALEEVEEQMSGFNVNIAGVSPACSRVSASPSCRIQRHNLLNLAVAKV